MEKAQFELPKEIDKVSQELSTKAKTALDHSKEIVIENDEQYHDAAGFLKDYKAQAKALEEKRKGITGPMDLAKKGIMDFFREPLTWLESAETVIKKGMVKYQEKVEEERKAEEKRLQEAAEKERQKQVKLAEKREERAIASGKTEKAEEIREEIEDSTPVVAPTLASKKPAVAGISTKVTWSGEVTDLMALVKAVAAGTAPATLIIADQKVVNRMAKAMKKDFKYPGVKAVSSSTIAARV